MMNKIYFESFTCLEDIVREFEIKDVDISNIEVIYAYYSYENYNGDAHVIYIQDGKLYEVNGSHCSCFGLDGQWEPEETTVQALMFRPNVAKEAKANLKQRYHNLMPFL